MPAPRGFTSNTGALEARLATLATRYDLPAQAPAALRSVLELLAAEPVALTSVRDPVAGADVHVADSLVALVLAQVREARAIADLGAGGGFPGLALAAALPAARVTLVESVGKKCAFLRRAAGAADLANVEVACARAEAWPAGIGAADLVTARALAPLGVVLEYSAPLLALGGSVVAWKGRREPAEEADAAAAAGLLGLSEPRSVRVEPFDGAGERHLYLSRKLTETPPGFPRRPGTARKRPLAASTTG